jgi:hypothetical protein
MSKYEAIIRKVMRISKGNNMRRTNRNITRTKSWTNKRSSRSMSITHKKKESRDPSIRRNLMLGSWVFMLWEKLWSLSESNTEKSHKPNSHKNQTHEKHGSEVGEPFSDSCHVLRAIGVHQPNVLQSSVQHLHRTKRGRWLNAGVSEINLRNSALNHVTWGGLYSLLHLTL